MHPAAGEAVPRPGRWARLLRHRWWDETDVHRVLDDAAVDRLAQHVAGSERQHSGEIRVCIEAGLPLRDLWHRRTARERAQALFAELGVWDTARNNGVLVYVLLAEHAIEIVTDRAVAAVVPASHWQALVHGMQQAFAAGRFEQGLAQAIDAVHQVLQRHFARAPGDADVNELPDAPLRR